MNTFDKWDDFEVNSKHTKNGGAKESFKKYKLFSEGIRKIPKADLIKRGFLNESDDTSSMSKLFQNLTSNELTPLFRKSETSNDALIAIWLSKISHDAKLLVSQDKISDFKGIQKEELKELARMSVNEEIFRLLPDILAKKGIVLIYELAFSGMKLDGAVFSIASGHPVIGISFRYPRLDHFWFTLMHELSHICLHYSEIANPILDDFDIGNETLIEMQANRLAKDTFVERFIWRTCNAKNDNKDDTVVEFAEEIHVHPAIVAGLLRKEKNKYDIYNTLINKIDVREKVFNNV